MQSCLGGLGVIVLWTLWRGRMSLFPFVLWCATLLHVAVLHVAFVFLKFTSSSLRIHVAVFRCDSSL